MTCGKIDLGCRKCRLFKSRTQVVPGKGPCRSRIVFVGEAPGKDEDAEGEPFVGRAGRTLDEALERAGASRESVYISNLVKCRPPGNRKPRKDEIEACFEYISSELGSIKPTVVCALGQTAVETILQRKVTMSKLVGRVIDAECLGVKLRVFVAYHPAACLYQKSRLPEFREHIGKALELAGY